MYDIYKLQQKWWNNYSGKIYGENKPYISVNITLSFIFPSLQATLWKQEAAYTQLWNFTLKWNT